MAYVGIGLGGAVFPWISHTLVKQYGWQTALQISGALVIAIAFPLVFFLKEPSSERDSRESSPPTPVGGAFKTLRFYLLALGSMCSIAAVAGTQQNLKLFLSLDQKYAQSESAQILSLVLAFSIFGRLSMGWLADRIPKKYVMLLIYTLVAVAIPFLFFAKTKAAVFVFAAIFGIGLGGDYMIIPLMTAELFGVRMLGRLMGVILTADGVAEAASPWLIANLRDVSGSYRIGFVVLIGMALLGACAVMALPRKRSTS